MAECAAKSGKKTTVIPSQVRSRARRRREIDFGPRLRHLAPLCLLLQLAVRLIDCRHVGPELATDPPSLPAGEPSQVQLGSQWPAPSRPEQWQPAGGAPQAANPSFEAAFQGKSAGADCWFAFRDPIWARCVSPDCSLRRPI